MGNNITLEIRDGIAVIGLNRPDKLNAISAEILEELDRILSELEERKEINVLIFTGRGRSFAAGADIPQMKELNYEQALEFSRLGTGVFSRIQHTGRFTIAVVEGYALGAGNELALACDFRIASRNAKFGNPEVKLGLIPGFGGIKELMDTVGPATAKDILLTGRTVNADEALRLGLINMVVESDELMESAMKIACQARQNSANAIMHLKEIINKRPGLGEQTRIFAELCSSDDAKERMKGFMEHKR